MNYRKNVQRPSRLLSFLTRFVRTISGLFRKQKARPAETPTRPIVKGWNGPTKTDHHGFGNPLTRKQSWWIPPDLRAEPIALTPTKHRNGHRRLLQRVARQ